MRISSYSSPFGKDTQAQPSPSSSKRIMNYETLPRLSDACVKPLLTRHHLACATLETPLHPCPSSVLLYLMYSICNCHLLMRLSSMDFRAASINTHRMLKQGSPAVVRTALRSRSHSTS